MGWAKYYEDNVSIYEDRMYLRNNKDYTSTTTIITNISYKKDNKIKILKNNKNIHTNSREG